MELDETDPAVWAKLDSATQDYIEANESFFQIACDCLEPPSQGEDTWVARHRSNGRFSAPGKLTTRGKADHSKSVFPIAELDVERPENIQKKPEAKE